MTDIETVKAMVEYLNSIKEKRMGFIGVPNFNGFDIYEFDGDKLRSLVYVLSHDFQIKEKE